MSTRKVVVTGSTFPADLLRRLQDARLEVRRVPGDLDEEGVIRELDGAWAYILGGSERIGRQAWRRVPQLRIVAFLGTGYESFLELPERGGALRFTYTPDANVDAVAEFTVALMLDLVRGVSARVAQVAGGTWTEQATPSLIGGRLGICGTGRIGLAVARIAKAAFGADVFYWNHNPRPELARFGYTACDSLIELCGTVDVLSVNCAYIPGRNDHLIGADELAALGSRSYLVNTARAELVDPRALRDALRSGTIAAAALDGYYIEPTPLPGHDPFGLIDADLIPDRLLVSPHTGYLTTQAARRMAEKACESVLAMAAGNEPPHTIPGR